MATTARAKRQPEADDRDRDHRLVGSVEERLSAASTRDRAGIWKLRKRDPVERMFLIRLARNLHGMLASVPHGRKTQALAAAGFLGDEQSGYLGNVTVPPDVMEVEGDRLRRLSPKVQRYVDVALSIELDRKKALATLFRGTPPDNETACGSREDWADRLGDNLAKTAVSISARCGLGPLFDYMSNANLCLGDDPGFHPRVTDWLSETFHKFEFADRLATAPNGFWLFDRTEEGTPRGGAPLFSPKIALAERTIEWQTAVRSFAPAGNDVQITPRSVTILFRSTLYLALAPMARDLSVPATAMAWLLERPTTSNLSYPDDPVWRITEGKAGLILSSELGEWTLPKRELSSFDRLFIEREEAHAIASPDLISGCWWCMPVNPETLRERTASKSDTVLLRSDPPPASFLAHALDSGAEYSEVDLHAVDPAVFAPWGSLAAAIQKASGSGLLARLLQAEVAKMDSGLRDLRSRLRSAHEGGTG